MKKLFSTIILLTLLLSVFAGCDKNQDPSATEASTVLTTTEAPTDVPTSKVSTKKLEALIDPDFAEDPFEGVVEGEPLTDEEIKNIISGVPSDKYESYPDVHNAPSKAALYKNGEVSYIEPDDERLISLINFYNRAFYHDQYAYSQGLLNATDINEIKNEDFRLELTYVPEDAEEVELDNATTVFDTIIITNDGVYLFAHDLPGYEGQEERYPFFAVSHWPLYVKGAWLDLFGF